MAELKDAYAIAVVHPGKDDEHTIRLKQPTDGQYIQIVRATSVIQRAGGEGPAVVNAIARCMDVLLAIVEDHRDKFWLDDGLTEGTLEVDDMKPLMDAIGDALEQDAPAPRNGPAARRTQRAVNGRR